MFFVDLEYSGCFFFHLGGYDRNVHFILTHLSHSHVTRTTLYFVIQNKRGSLKL
jgi:hypothetical protein